MSEPPAPERIWVEGGIAKPGSHGSTAWLEPCEDYPEKEYEYVPATLYNAQARELAEARAEVEKYEALAQHRGKQMAALEPEVSGIADKLDDEGDRVYFGSTNDADALINLAGQLQETMWEVEEPDVCEPDFPADNLKLRAEVEALREALTPSGATKCAYSSEFEWTRETVGENGDEVTETLVAPWTVIKDIMAAISARAALAKGGE